MRYYLIAGEASGDLHASNLMRALKAYDAEAEFRFFGGDSIVWAPGPSESGKGAPGVVEGGGRRDPGPFKGP